MASIPNSQPLLLSLKPLYADLVFSGLKTAELRRRVSRNLVNRDVFVYVSSPVMELRGGFRVGEVWSGAPSQLWGMVSQLAGVSRDVFNDYYAGSDLAYAMEIQDVWEFENPVSLSKLRDRFDGFVPPQSYRYLRDEEVRSFGRQKRVALRPVQAKSA